MAKQVLGRNLEELLDDGTKEAGKANPFSPETAPVGSGVRSLMRGHPTTPARASADEPVQKPVVPGWYLLGADILLAALALIIVCKSPHPLSWPRELFCAAAVVLGGCLALAAVLRARGQAKD
ncbi:MAG: hypothetical protein ACLQU4_06520 [Limisphaerales bacterium]